MWKSVINYFHSLWTYPDLSPDIGIRRQINLRLRDRPQLCLGAWSSLLTQTQDKPIPLPLLAFIYQKLQEYSGLDAGRIRGGDRLIEDLQLPLVCWFDWSNQLCDDFFEAFQVDITEALDESRLDTVGDLVWFLNRQLQSIDPITSG